MMTVCLPQPADRPDFAIPNLLPIVLVVGVMGWLDLPINIGTAMISSVSMGLTVDASISIFRRFAGCRQGARFFGRPARDAARDRPRADLFQFRADSGVPRADTLALHPAGVLRVAGQRGDAGRPRWKPGAAPASDSGD